MFNTFSDAKITGFRSILSDAKGTMTSVSSRRIPAVYMTMTPCPAGIDIQELTAGENAAMSPDNAREVAQRETKGVLKFCRGVPISPVEEYLKYADSMPYTQTTFRNAMME